MGSRNSILLIFLLFSVSLVFAQPVYQQETDVTLSIPCTINGDVCNASATCVGTIINPNDVVLYNEQSMTQSGAVFELDLNTTDTAVNGEYRLAISCTQGGESNSKNLLFHITPSGENPEEEKTSLNIVFLGIFVLFFIISLLGIFYVDNYIGKFTLYWVTHVLGIIVLFISWQTASSFLTTETAITGLLNMLWYISMIAVFPMLILSLMWVFYIHAYNEHFQKLIGKGVDVEEAFRITNKKKGGWFNGN